MALIRGNGGLNIRFYVRDPEKAHFCAEPRVLAYFASKSVQGPWLQRFARTPPQKKSTFWCAIWRAKSRMRGNETPGRIIIIIIIIIIIVGFSVYLHNSPGDITQFNNKSMQKTEKF